MIKTADGKMVKENPDVTAKMQSQLNVFKIAAHRGEILQSLQGHPGWDTIQEILTEKIETINNKLADFENQDQRKNDLLLQQRKDYSFLLNIVDDFSQSVSGCESAILRTEKELESRKSQSVV